MSDALDRLERLRLLGLGQLPEPEPQPDISTDAGYAAWVEQICRESDELMRKLLAEIEANPFVMPEIPEFRVLPVVFTPIELPEFRVEPVDFKPMMTPQRKTN